MAAEQLQFDASFVASRILVFLFSRESDEWAQWRADYCVRLIACFAAECFPNRASRQMTIFPAVSGLPLSLEPNVELCILLHTSTHCFYKNRISILKSAKADGKSRF
jgi:hypothetical protein